MIRRTLLFNKLTAAFMAACIALTLTLALSLGTARAHEHRAVHEYTFVVGFIQEPAFEGLLNAVSVRITKSQDGQGHAMQGMQMQGESKDKSGDMSMSMSMMGHGGGMPIEGLETTLAVEVTHASSGVKQEMPLSPVRADPGHYTAYFIPTATGQYTFRFIGSVEGMPIDETFESGPGRFAHIEPADAIQFPESAASTRELEAAVRGALESAQQAQDTALALESAADSAKDSASTATTLAIASIVVGAIGIIIGGIGTFAALRRRN